MLIRSLVLSCCVCLALVVTACSDKKTGTEPDKPKVTKKEVPAERFLLLFYRQLRAERERGLLLRGDEGR